MSSSSSSSNTITTTAAMDPSHPLWVKEWKEGQGEATIRLRQAETNKDAPTLFCSWFCPFAQRAWIAMEEINVPYKYVEINPYEVDPSESGGYTKQALSIEAKRKLVPEFIDTSPRGLVPALRESNGIRIWESDVLVEYVDEVYGKNNNNRLMPESPELKALVRIYVDHCTARIQKSFYQYILEQSKEGQEQYKNAFFRECKALACAMAPIIPDNGPLPAQILESTLKENSKIDVSTLAKVSQDVLDRHSSYLQPGPFFLGSKFSAVDISLAPFWQRILWVGSYYRGLELPNDPAFERLHKWWDAVSQRPSVANTIVGKDRLISTYSQYARNIATSDAGRNIQASLGNSSSKK